MRGLLAACVLACAEAWAPSSARSAGSLLRMGAEQGKLLLQPIGTISGEFTLPGSKSLSNRVLLLAALSEGETLVENLLDSADIRYMVAALQQLKVPVIEDKARMTAAVVGNGGPIDSAGAEELFLGNAGTAMRPLAGVLCAGSGRFVLDGSPRMRERPIVDLVQGLVQARRPASCTTHHIYTTHPTLPYLCYRNLLPTYPPATYTPS